MPSSQPSAAAAPNSEQRRNDKTVTSEPPKLKTALKTPPKQATNPLQFVKVGPCALYRTAQEQLSKVQEVKKVETKVKDDPEDWQSNLDNWKSSRRKRQEHIIERVVEVKKLELEEHDRNRKRCKTFSELMEERGRKLSLSLAVYNEDDANDLSDLGIGTSSGKSSVSGDTHDDSHSVLSDRDSEIDKNHSDVDNAGHENGNDSNNSRSNVTPSKLSSGTKTLVTPKSLPLKREVLNNGFHKNNGSGNNHNNQDYDSATTATTSSPEPDEYGYEATPTRNYVPRISQGFSQKLHPFDQKHEVEFSSYGKNNGLEEKRNGDAAAPVVKVDILKRREIFEKAARENENRNNNINNNRVEITNTKSIKERLSILERQKSESEFTKSPRHSIDSGNSIKERFNMEKQSSFEKDVKARDMLADELESVKPVKEILSNLEKFRGNCAQDIMTANAKVQSYDDEYNSKFIKERLISLDAARCKEMDKHSNNFYSEQQANMRMENLTPSERSSSPDSEYRAPRATFHQSLDSLDADASSGPDTFERVQSLEELDYHQSRRYPASSSSAEILNDTDREDSGIHTADASCSVSQADEPIEEEIGLEKQYPPMILEEKTEFRSTIESTLVETSKSLEKVEEKMANMTINNSEPCVVVLTEKGTADITSSSSTCTGEAKTLCANNRMIEPPRTSTNATSPQHSLFSSSSSRPVVYQSPKVPPRRSPPDIPPKPSYLPLFSSFDTSTVKEEITLNNSSTNVESPSEGMSSTPDSSSTNTVCSVNMSMDSESFKKPSPSTCDPLSSNSSSPKSDTKVIMISPLPSPRTPSKIPTPLPRKSISSPSSSSITSPCSPMTSIGSPSESSSFPIAPMSPPRQKKNPPPLISPRSPQHQSNHQPSEIPLRTKVTSPPTSPRIIRSPDFDLRRRTVVEVCEKLVVPRGQAQVTPYIVVERYADEVDANTEVKKQPADAAAVAAAAAAAELAAKEVEEEKEEERVAEPATATTTTAAAEKKPEPLAEEQAPVLDEPLSHLEEPEEEEDDRELEDDPEEDFPKKSSTMAETVAPPPPPAPVRPTTLMLERTTLEPEFLSPLSPVSSNPILPLSFSSDEEIVTGLSFPLGPPTSVEPPKEKPPPPPVDLSDEENHPIEPLKRLNSTRRIKKELRSRRSDFLGIEGFNDDELERELTLTKPPDMAAILAEERRIEQLHRRSYDTDSNYEQDSSHERDSGVELGQAEDWTKQPVSPDMSQHSRQSSEPFGASVTSSEEDEITKKEREIIEVLEKEEQWRYENNREMDSDIGEKLAHKLRELEEEKMQLERERASKEACDNQQQRRRHQEPTAETLRMNEENLRKQEEILRREDEARQQELEKQLAEEKLQLKAQGDRIQEQQLKMQNERENRNVELCRKEDLPIRIIEKNAPEIKAISPAPSSNGDECSREVLRVERELLQLEQEELKRQRSNLAYREQKQQQLAEQLQEQWKSLQDVAQISPPPRPPYAKPQPPINYRASMPNLQMQEAATAAAIGQRRRPPPPPIPPAKPLRLVEQRQRDVTIRNSRIPSADSIPQQVETPLRPSRSVVALTNVQQQHQQAINAQQMSRQTLQALSAAPRPRMIQADQWVQRRKSDIPRGSQDFNYQHWLIQEAEQRRISEKNQRSPAHKPVHVTGTSVPYSVVSPPRPIENKPLPDSIIQTLTQRVQSRVQEKPLSPRRRLEHSTSQEHLHMSQYQHPQQPQQQKHQQSPQQQQQKQPQPMQQQQKQPQQQQAYQQLQQQQQQQSSPQQNKQQQSPSSNNTESQEKMLSVSGKKKCSHCGDELGRGAAMIIESLRLFYHMECFKCCVCHVKLGDGLMGTDVRVRNHKLHCHNCYSSDDGVKFSCV